MGMQNRIDDAKASRAARPDWMKLVAPKKKGSDVSVREGAKKCSKCGETKTYDLFHKNATRRDGHQAWCKICSCAASKETYHANRSK